MTQHSVSESGVHMPSTAHVPLSERPLVAEDENTVISAPEGPKSEVRAEPVSAHGDSIRARLFPAGGLPTGEEAGIRIEHFEIRERLGAGGMGAVFRASDLELARDVALKILHPGSTQDGSLILRFRNEARACAQLSHDNIARVFYAGSFEGLYFIAYEFASGRTIRDLIVERGRLTTAETVNYAIQVTLALNHIAAAGIVHRDIKPSNIMLTDSGRVKVVDLGLARRDTTDSIGDITVAGTTLGTFDYIAPEQARDPRNADVRSDIYSLGCTMYHMLTGQPPYPDGTALQKLLDHQGKSPPDPRSINNKVPPALSAIMKKMMANNPELRYQAAGQLLNDLIRMAGMLGLQSVPAEGIVWKKVPRASTGQPLGAVWMFASVLLICVTAVFLHQMPRENSLSATGASDEENWKQVKPEEYASLLPDETPGAGSAGPSPGDTTSTQTAPPAAVTDSGNAAGTLPEFKWDQPELTLVPVTGPVTPALVQMGFSAFASGGKLPAPAAEIQQMGPFVLQGSDGTSLSFRTLKAAVSEAKSGDLILLRYNGYPDDLPAQPPVRIVGTNLTIRAADGFRPTLEFDGSSEGSVAPGQMFGLRNQASLSIRDIDLRMIVREDLNADRWSLFHCAGANRIQLENVSLECRNPDEQPVVLFELMDESTTVADGPGAEVEISLTRVICRSESDAFRVACQPRGRIRLTNCGLAVTGRLLDLRGDASMQPSRGSLELYLDHVTCLHGESAIAMNDNDGRQSGLVQRLLPRLSIRSEASVFTATKRNRPLLQSNGSSFIEDIEGLVSWNGFTNLYQNYPVFWQIESFALDDSTRRIDFSQWKQLWQNRGDSEDTNAELLPESAWRYGDWSEGTGFGLQAINPAVFELDAALFLPGLGSLPRARDGLIPGVNSQELPPFPIQRISVPQADEDDLVTPIVTPAPM
ncbi:MAG: serine/threonine protein kinase [Planctomycetaceae bacterium]|nr:serine/threonine protein kinase [Planctomycetaceae bacterium]